MFIYLQELTLFFQQNLTSLVWPTAVGWGSTIYPDTCEQTSAVFAIFLPAGLTNLYHPGPFQEGLGKKPLLSQNKPTVGPL